MRTKCLSLCICAVLLSAWLLPGLALAQAYTENLVRYSEQYADTLGQYRTHQVGEQHADVLTAAKALRDLGYYPVENVDYLYSKAMSHAVVLFAQQMGIGGGTAELTPLVQAVLLSGEAEPPAIPPVHVRLYSYQGVRDLALYTYDQLHTASTGKLCSFQGRVESIEAGLSGEVELVLALHTAQERVRVYYQMPDRSPDFSVGDDLVVLGKKQGHTDTEVEITGDQIGFAK